MSTHLVLRIARDLGHAAPEASQIVGSGTINQVFAVGDLIVRLNDDRSPEEALAEYEKESWCHSQAAKVDVRVPEVFAVGMAEERAYIAMERIEGHTARADDEEAWFAMGAAVRRIHRLEGPEDPQERAKLFRIVKGKSARDAWQEILVRNVQELTPTDPLLSLGVYSVGQRSNLLRTFEGLLHTEFGYGLCHGDLAARNLILSLKVGPVLIDWGCATLGAVPDQDLVEITGSQEGSDQPTADALNAFFRGYGSGVEVARTRLPAVRLVKAFDLVRWAIDRAPDRKAELVSRARRTVNSVYASL